MIAKNVVEETLDRLISKIDEERAKVLESPEYKALCAKRDALIAKIQPLEAELREVQAQIKPMEAPTRDLGNQKAALVRAKMETKTLANTGQS